jgi:transposase
MDMAPNMAKAIRRCFRNARHVIDRFHVQELRIKYRWEVLDAENKKIMESPKRGNAYEPELLPNGDTLKQHWLGLETPCSSTQANSPKTKNNELNSCSCAFPS